MLRWVGMPNCTAVSQQMGQKVWVGAAGENGSRCVHWAGGYMASVHPD